MRNRLLQNLFTTAALILLSGMLGQNVVAQLSRQPPEGVSEAESQQAQLGTVTMQGLVLPSYSLMSIDN